jgi:hypothetical protein
MGTRELFLALGAILLFGIVAMSANNSLFSDQEIIWNNEMHLTAFGIAQQYLEEAKAKEFDEYLVNSTVIPTGILNYFSTTMGKDSGDLSADSLNDDFDDYNGLIKVVKKDSSLFNRPFTVKIKVGYVSESNPEVFQSTRSFYKRMEVEVSNNLPYFTPVKLDYVKAYWGAAP